MKMFTGGIKGISAVVIAWLTYIDKTFTPLFWVLLALVALDMFLSAHKEGQQFQKIGSMAVSLGVPSYISTNLSNPELGKYLVAIMCLVYLQVVVPQLVAKIGDLKISKDPIKNEAAQGALEELLKKVEALAESQANAVVKETTQDAPAPKVDQGGQGGV